MDKYLKEKGKNKSKIFQVSKLEEFIELVTHSDDNLIFRGQQQDWELLPSVARLNSLDQEKFIFEEFKREAIPYLMTEPEPRDDWQWLALAQHNGLPTRLLDWTRNPLAALWFAVNQSAHEDEPGVVWTLNNYTLEDVYDSSNQSSPFEITQPKIYFPPHISPYLQAQRGVFTVHDLFKKQFQPLESKVHNDLIMDKIVIPAASFSTMRYHLARLNVTAASLFPGLGGLARKLEYKMIFDVDKLPQ